MPNVGSVLANPAAAVLLASASPSGTGVVTFSSIPQTYRNLRVLVMARGTQAAVVETVMTLTLNNDTGAGNYASQFVGALAASAVAAETLSTTGLAVGSVTAATAPASAAASFDVWIFNYTDTTFHKPVECTHARRTTTGSAGMIIAAFAGFWIATPAAVNRLDFTLASGNFVAGSLLTLYGIP